MIKRSSYTYGYSWYWSTCFVPHDKLLYWISHVLNWLFYINYIEKQVEDNNDYDLLIIFTITLFGFVFTLNRYVVFE